jgi:hypothetical protein
MPTSNADRAVCFAAGLVIGAAVTMPLTLAIAEPKPHDVRAHAGAVRPARLTTAPQPRRRITMPEPTIGFIEGPVTGTTDIDWLSSTTTKQVRRYPVKDDTTTVEHIAHFGVLPGSVPDMLAEYSRTTSFQPEFLIARWNDGELRSVVLSGSASDKVTRKRGWREYRSPVDKADLPGKVAEALTAYEQAVAGVAANGGDHE